MMLAANRVGTGMACRSRCEIDTTDPIHAALELPGALQSLGEISGKIDTEEILGTIFSRFCIGN